VPLVVDAGVLYAQADRTDPHHQASARLLQDESGLLITTELVVAEADYLILHRLGIDAELAFLMDLSQGTFNVECLSRQELSKARELALRYKDLELGLADVSLVILADRHKTRRIATFDQRAFRLVTPLQGGAFEILPADAPQPKP
jgi:predicted nucleic acid-binding protein